MEREKKILPSPAGNWTPVSRVTGGDTDHYTTEEPCKLAEFYKYKQKYWCTRFILTLCKLIFVFLSNNFHKI